MDKGVPTETRPLSSAKEDALLLERGNKLRLFLPHRNPTAVQCD